MLYKLKSSPEVSFRSIQYFLYKYFLHYLNELLPFKIKNDGQFFKLGEEIFLSALLQIFIQILIRVENNFK